MHLPILLNREIGKVPESGGVLHYLRSLRAVSEVQSCARKRLLSQWCQYGPGVL